MANFIRRSSAALAFATVLGGMGLASAPVSATAVQHGSGKVPFLTQGAWKTAHAISMKARHAHAVTNLTAHGGIDGIEVTTGAPKVYVVFYGSQWGTQGTDSNGYATFTGDPKGIAPRIQAMFKGIGTNSELWSGVQTQYCDGALNGATSCAAGLTHVGYPTGGALAGVWYDNSVASATQSTGNALATEAVLAAGHFGNTTATLNRSAQYVIVSPTGTHPDGFNTTGSNFCAWHDYNGDTTLTGGAAASSYGDIAFTNMPYITDLGTSCGANYVNAGTAGALDGVTIVGGHEYAETITDQNPGGGWWDSVTGMENSDKCAWNGTGGTTGAQNVNFATGSFAMQANWSNEVSGCQIAHAIVGGPVTNDFSVALSPTSSTVTAGGSATSTVSTATTSGTAQTVALTVTGAPTGVTATLSPTSVTSGSSSTLSIATTSTTAAGTYTLTITGTATSGFHTASYSLKVNAPTTTNDFSIALSPTSGTVTAGGSTTTSVSTAVTSGSNQKISFSAQSSSNNLSVSFSPSSATTGTSVTATITARSRISKGTYTVTITGKTSTKSHSATYTVTV